MTLGKGCLKLGSLVAMLAVASAVTGGCATRRSAALSDLARSLDLPPGPVDVTIEIVWTNRGGAPVEGAKVFSHERNELLGVTGKDGRLNVTVENGTVLRLVEPQYGQQQALRLVQGQRIPNQNGLVAKMGDGWTWT